MYEAFYGLPRRPFAVTPDPSCWYSHGPYQGALDELLVCADQGQGIGILVAPAGAGKTVLCERFLKEIAPRFATVLLRHAPFSTRRALLQTILAELDQPFDKQTDQELRLGLAPVLRGLHQSGRALMLVVDEAHQLSEGLLEELRILADQAIEGWPLVRLILAGQPLLEDKLTHPVLSALSQRVRAQVVIPTLTQAESADYIDYRITWAGGLTSDLFTPEALQLMCQAADGVPRCLNQLCDHALLLGYVSEQQPVTAETVANALDDLRHLPLPWNPLPLLSRSTTPRGMTTSVVETGSSPSKSADSVADLEAEETCETEDVIAEDVIADEGSSSPPRGFGEQSDRAPFRLATGRHFTVVDDHSAMAAKQPDGESFPTEESAAPFRDGHSSSDSFLVDSEANELPAEVPLGLAPAMIVDELDVTGGQNLPPSNGPQGEANDWPDHGTSTIAESDAPTWTPGVIEPVPSESVFDDHDECEEFDVVDEPRSAVLLHAVHVDPLDANEIAAQWPAAVEAALPSSAVPESPARESNENAHWTAEEIAEADESLQIYRLSATLDAPMPRTTLAVFGDSTPPTWELPNGHQPDDETTRSEAASAVTSDAGSLESSSTEALVTAPGFADSHWSSPADQAPQFLTEEPLNDRYTALDAGLAAPVEGESAASRTTADSTNGGHRHGGDLPGSTPPEFVSWEAALAELDHPESIDDRLKMVSQLVERAQQADEPESTGTPPQAQWHNNPSQNSRQELRRLTASLQQLVPTGDGSAEDELGTTVLELIGETRGFVGHQDTTSAADVDEDSSPSSSPKLAPPTIAAQPAAPSADSVAAPESVSTVPSVSRGFGTRNQSAADLDQPFLEPRLPAVEQPSPQAQQPSPIAPTSAVFEFGADTVNEFPSHGSGQAIENPATSGTITGATHAAESAPPSPRGYRNLFTLLRRKQQGRA